MTRLEFEGVMAAALLSEAASVRGSRSIVVIDEFENLPALKG